MRNEEKHALRRELRRARAQMGHQGRLAAGQTVNRLLKRYIKKGRKIGVYWPMGSELRLERLCPSGAKTRRQTLSTLYRTAFAADVVHALSCRRSETRTQTRQGEAACTAVYGTQNPCTRFIDIACPDCRHGPRRLPLRAGWRLLRCDARGDEIPFTGKNHRRRLRLSTG